MNGISLHSYRYAWAERAQSCGYPERWAQNALGHNSRAIRQAYAKGGVAICPPLDDYERIANKILNAFFHQPLLKLGLVFSRRVLERRARRGQGRLTALALVAPVFCYILGGLVQSILVGH